MKKDSLAENLHECLQHKKRLLSAQKNLKNIMPIDVSQYKSLDDTTISVIDQLLFRFSKLQDSLGEKVFNKILYIFGEDVKKMTFIDKLNRLEELELLNKNQWLELRKYRNEIAHEYSYNQQEVVDSINLIYSKTQDLIKILDQIYTYLKDKQIIEG